MKTLIAQIKDVVPRGVKITATVVLCLAIVCAVIFGFMSGVSDAHAVRGKDMPAVVAIPIALLVGTFVALWLLAMGYVYADSKRRGMPPVLWLAIALMVPNMIGFILYFALRKPLLSACANCGQGVMPDQKFCPSCGSEQGPNSPSNASSSGPGSIPLNRQPDGLARKSLATGLSVWIVIFAAKGMFMYWKHAMADAGGLLILAGICAWLAWLMQPKQIPQRML